LAGQGLVRGGASVDNATIVRLILVPATMEIMGRWNWWLPRPLARILPRADFEAGTTERMPARA
jgi:uncharacterized membrane protein YdfJ with MMPL/SSD domain